VIKLSESGRGKGPGHGPLPQEGITPRACATISAFGCLTSPTLNHARTEHGDDDERDRDGNSRTATNPVTAAAGSPTTVSVDAMAYTPPPAAAVPIPAMRIAVWHESSATCEPDGKNPVYPLRPAHALRAAVRSSANEREPEGSMPTEVACVKAAWYSAIDSGEAPSSPSSTASNVNSPPRVVAAVRISMLDICSALRVCAGSSSAALAAVGIASPSMRASGCTQRGSTELTILPVKAIGLTSFPVLAVFEHQSRQKALLSFGGHRSRSSRSNRSPRRVA
jgi:hypothetical protein